MTKLVLEEGGTQRSFRIGAGRLTVGSGAQAKLRLQSAGVAEIHFELEVGERGVELTPRPGVLPPEVDGQPVEAVRVLARGEKIRVGEAVLWLEGEEEESPAGAGQGPERRAAPVKPKPARRAGARSGERAEAPARSGEPRRRVVGKPKSHTANRSLAHRTKPRVRRGLPSWAIVLLVLGGVGFSILFLWRGFSAQARKGTAPLWATLQGAREDLAQGSLENALGRLDRIAPGVEIGPEERQEIDALRAEIEARRSHAVEMVENLSGTQYLEATLKQYEEKYLMGDPDPAKVRLFLMRAAEFRRRWPKHPEMDWVDRQERRLRGLVDMAAAPDWDAIQWEVKWIRAQSVRDYARAFSLLDTFLEDAKGRERAGAIELRSELVPERKEYVEDRLQQARYEYDHYGDASKAVWWLVNIIVSCGDPEMAREAAGFLVKIPNLKGHLEAYERKYPDRYHAVLRNPVVRAAAKEQGLIE